MIPSTTRAPHAYSNDWCTVTARARLTLQSFPTNKTLNTGPLPLSSPSECCNELHTSRKKLHSELYLFFTYMCICFCHSDFIYRMIWTKFLCAWNSDLFVILGGNNKWVGFFLHMNLYSNEIKAFRKFIFWPATVNEDFHTAHKANIRICSQTHIVWIVSVTVIVHHQNLFEEINFQWMTEIYFGPKYSRLCAGTRVWTAFSIFNRNDTLKIINH